MLNLWVRFLDWWCIVCKQVIFICELVSPRDVNVVSVMKIKLFYLMDDAA